MKINVACGVIFDKDGNILMGRRSKNYDEEGYWEFPGGKQENNELLIDCLIREWKEELNLDIQVNKYLTINENNKYKCYFFKGNIIYNEIMDISLNVHDKIGFFNKEEIINLKLFDGDNKVIELIN